MLNTGKIFIKNSSIYFAGLLVSGVISILTIPLIVKEFGVEKYGSFSLIQNIILILIVFGGGWLNQCILRFNDFSTSFKILVFKSYFLVLIPLSVICFFLLFFLGLNVPNSIVGVFIMFLGSVSSLLISFHQSNLNANKSFYFDFIRNLTFISSLFFIAQFFQKNNSNAVLILCFFLSYFASFIFLLRYDFKFLYVASKIFIRRLNYNHINSIVKQNFHLLNYGWPLALWFTFSYILNISDRYIIGYYLSASELGTYSAIYDLVYKGITFIYSPVLVAGFPILVHKYNLVNKESAYQFLQKLIFLEILIFLVIIIFAFFLKSFFIEKIVGVPVTSQSLALILPITCGAFVWQLAMLMHKPLEFELKTKFMLFYVILALLINIVLNVLFIPRLGILFASYSTIISAFLYLFLCFIYTFKLKKTINASVYST